MSTWRNRLRTASFRGVSFFIESTDADIGRRVEILRFPGRSDIVDQDLGGDARSFSVTAFVVGPDYDTDRARLEAALLQPGVGTLVHPTRGEMIVVVHDRIRIHESRDKGGMATITFQCTEAREQNPVFAEISVSGAVVDLADVVSTAATASMVASVKTHGLSAGVLSSQITMLGSMSAAMNAARQTVG